MDFKQREHYQIQDLLKIVAILRGPGGCPWDIEQTHNSIRQNLIEETYEAIEAIDLADSRLLCEELGDLMLQVALHTQMAQESGEFSFDDVCDGICKKLIFRHPHVFENAQDLSCQQVLTNWEALKNQEKGRSEAEHRLESVPKSLPSAMRAAKVQKRADEYGFAYPDAKRAIEDLESELAELKAAISHENVEEEIGDVLFSAVNVARLFKLDAELALTKSTDKFVARVKAVQKMAKELGILPQSISQTQLNALWQRAKDAKNKGPTEKSDNIFTEVVTNDKK